MNKDTDDIEIKILSSEDIEMLEGDGDADLAELDGALIEEIYQEQISAEEIGKSASSEENAEADGKAGEEVRKTIGSGSDENSEADGSAVKSESDKNTEAAEEIDAMEDADGMEDTEDADRTEQMPAGAGEKVTRQNRFRTLKKCLKGLLLIVELFLLFLIVYFVVILVQSDSKADFASRISQSTLGRFFISTAIKDSYDQNVKETIKKEEISVNPEIDQQSNVFQGDYTTFVIFGIDARGDEFESGTNSDTIIIVSIQNETGRVRMASVYRDTYLPIETNSGKTRYAKVNSAYSSGGALRAINTLNANFDLAIEDYVVVNFSGVADIIDALGGLDINLTSGEVKQLNTHLKSTMSSTGKTTDYITSSGLNHLDGLQALTFARIRKTAFTNPVTGEEYNNDYGRVARQQYVISLMVEKAKAAGVNELLAIANRLLGSSNEEEKVIGTTFELDEILDMIPVAIDFELDGSTGYPDEKTTRLMSDLHGADCVIALDLVADVSALHEFLYDEENYSPTATVRNTAAEIISRMETYGYHN